MDGFGDCEEGEGVANGEEVDVREWGKKDRGQVEEVI